MIALLPLWLALAADEPAAPTDADRPETTFPAPLPPGPEREEPPPPRVATFRFGRIQVHLGGGIALPSGFRLTDVVGIVEGYQHATAGVDVGLLTVGQVTLSGGAEVTASRQLFVNPLFAVRRAADRLIPEWVPPWLFSAGGPEIAWRWYARHEWAAARFAVHLNMLDGQPYLVLMGGPGRYGLHAHHATEPTCGRLAATGFTGAVGAGAARVVRGGVGVGAELRYLFSAGYDLPGVVPSHHPTEAGPTLYRRFGPPGGLSFAFTLVFRV